MRQFCLAFEQEPHDVDKLPYSCPDFHASVLWRHCGSFRFLVAKDTLALSYALGTIYPCSGLSPVRLRPCWAHNL